MDQADHRPPQPEGGAGMTKAHQAGCDQFDKKDSQKGPRGRAHQRRAGTVAECDRGPREDAGGDKTELSRQDGRDTVRRERRNQPFCKAQPPIGLHAQPMKRRAAAGS